VAHTAQAPADFTSVFRQRFAPLFGRKIGRQRAEQYLGGLLYGRAERRNVTALAGTVDGATARALGWLLNKSPWQTGPILDALQTYVGEMLGPTSPAEHGLYTLNLDSFVKRGDNAVGVDKQYVHHLGRTLNCQIGVFLAYGAGQGSALVDAGLYLPRTWIDGTARRAKAGVPDSVTYQPRSEIALDLLRRARAAGKLPGEWVTSWHGEGFEPDLRARLDADGWRYLIPVDWADPFYDSPAAVEPRPVSALAAGEPGGAFGLRRVWDVSSDTPDVESQKHPFWLVSCTDELTGQPVAFVSNAPEDDAQETLSRIVGARWDTARMLTARCAGVSLDVYRVRGWDGWHRHVALALLASAFRACLPALPEADIAVEP
jgi:SRSO17 transposase